MRRDIQFHSEEKLCLHLFIKGRVPSPWLFHDRTTASLVVNHNTNPWSCKRSWHVLKTRWMAIASLVVLTFLGEPIIRNLSCSGWKNTPSTIPNQEASVPTDTRMCRLSVLGNLPRKEITLWWRWPKEIVELVSLIKNQAAGTASERDTRFLKPLQSLTVTVRLVKLYGPGIGNDHQLVTDQYGYHQYTTKREPRSSRSDWWRLVLYVLWYRCVNISIQTVDYYY